MDNPTIPVNVIIDVVRGASLNDVIHKYNLTREQILDILESCPAKKNSRLTQTDILTIRQLNSELSTRQIADRYRITEGYVRMIKRKETV